MKWPRSKKPRRWWFFRSGPPGHLHFHPLLHGLPLLGCAALWSCTAIWRLRRPPMPLVWKEVNEQGEDAINRMDRRARELLLWEDPLLARQLSNLLANFVVPAGAVGLAVAAGVKGGGGPLADVLVANEAMVYAGTFSHAIKLLFRRQRPFARFSPAPEAKGVLRRPDDDNLSFFSSHTSTTMAFAFAAAQIVTRRKVRTPLVLLLGAAAGMTGYLRIASDRHYLSDVIVGAAVGAGIGTWVPNVLHPVRTPKNRLLWPRRAAWAAR